MAGFPGSLPTQNPVGSFPLPNLTGFNPFGPPQSSSGAMYTPMGNEDPSQYTGGGVNPFLQNALNQQNQTIGGQYLNPQSNQYLQAYYNAAAQPMIQQYEQATMPNIVGNAVMSGGLGGSAVQQNTQNANTALSQGLGNLAANIFEPAYAQERQLQQQSALGAGGTAGNMYLPAQELMNIGGAQQQQQQRYMSAPFEALAQYSGLIPGFMGGFSTSQVTGSGGK